MLQKTSLRDWHAGNGASMTDFHGWDMPLYYSGITEEHHHTRTKVSLFDLGHMGRVFVRGKKWKEFIDFLTAAFVSKAQPGEVQYSFFLRDNGTIIDDITVYYGADYAFLVINAGNRDRDIEWLTEQAEKFGDVELENCSVSWGMVAIQGPQSVEVLKTLFGPSIADMKYYSFDSFPDTIAKGDLIISRTGYTGEDGYELYLPTENVQKLWETLLGCNPDVEVKPAGLGARDSLRLEAGMPLYGHELDDNITPLHAGLGKFLNFDKEDFIGKQALLKIKEMGGASLKLVGFEMEKRGPVARQDFIVADENGNAVGKVTSGIFSPTLQKTIGLAYVEKDFAKIGSSINIEIRGKLLPARIIKKPFYKRGA